ncbi:MAG TPA: c-type cytochrome [Gemmatimonadales bacterium]|nr:c-type cytochrome [Gemmatimonadales bacterium]
MSGGRRAGVALLLVAAAAVPRTAPGAQRAAAQDTARGKAVYDRWCAQCHGETGAGDGPAAGYMLPRPRDFTAALYQVRSTASGELPTDADILRAIDQGLPGTAMPGWKGRLSADDRRALVAYLKTFSAFFEGATPQPLEFTGPPGGGEEAVRIGRQMYDSIGCAKCHGQAGRGDGPSTAELDDDAGHPIVAADLTQNWRFNGGGRVEDIYRTLRTGLDGTPMPSFSDLIDQRFLTDRELWHLAQYVRSLSPATPPRARDVILARRVDGPLPAAPDDSAWAGAEEFWVPLVGQIIRKSRWFASAVTGVRVRALHNGEELALRAAWNDRSQSPDTAWLAYARKVLAALAGDDSAPPEARPWPDQLVVQFPRRIPTGMERPYFLMGSGAEPVYQWRWQSGGPGAEEGTARGLERYEVQPPSSQTLGARAVYDQGEWRVVFTRALATPDTGNDLQFETGRPIPIAFFAWDGSSGEHGTRMAVSSWYYLALAEPTPPGVFLAPIVAAALTVGLGLLAVRQANRGRGGAGRPA